MRKNVLIVLCILSFYWINGNMVSAPKASLNTNQEPGNQLQKKTDNLDASMMSLEETEPHWLWVEDYPILDKTDFPDYGDFPFAPLVAVNSQGTIYVLSYCRSVAADNFFLTFSTDKGSTWDTFPIFHHVDELDLYISDTTIAVDMAIDLFSDQIYVVYSARNDIRLWRPLAASNRLVDIAVDPNVYETRPKIAIDYHLGENNKIYICYEESNPSSREHDVKILRSQDHGASFSIWRTLVGDSLVSYPAYPDIDVDGKGNIYLTYVAVDYDSSRNLYVEYGPRNSAASEFEHKMCLFSGTSDRTVETPRIAVSRTFQNQTNIAIAFTEAKLDAYQDIRVAYSMNEGSTWFVTNITNTPLREERFPVITVAGMGATYEVLGNFYLSYIFTEDLDPLTGEVLKWWVIEEASYNSLNSWSIYRNYTGESSDLEYDEWKWWDRPYISSRTGICTYEINGDWIPFLAYHWSNYNWDVYSATMRLISNIRSPAPLFPTNNTATNNLSIAFAWNPVAEATGYEIQVNNISKPVDLQDVTIRRVQWRNQTIEPQITLSIGAGGQFKWRLCAKDSHGFWGNWSEYWYFEIDLVGPSPPILISPRETETVRDQIIAFEWRNTSEEEVAHYQVDIFKVPSKPSQAIEVVHSENVSDCRPSVATTLQDGTYSWHVRAYDIFENAGAWSKNSSFYLNTTVPNRVVLLSPESGVILEYPTPYLDWEPLGAAETYQVQISNQTDFSTINQEVNTTNDDFIASLLANGTYYWRVRAKNREGVFGLWSSIWSFEIQSKISSLPKSTPGFGLIILLPTLLLAYFAFNRRRKTTRMRPEL
ncbi:MAG: hypothetical protein ACFFGZ_03125 [Candidatus Thorarchaeota archaeon]